MQTVQLLILPAFFSRYSAKLAVFAETLGQQPNGRAGLLQEQLLGNLEIRGVHSRPSSDCRHQAHVHNSLHCRSDNRLRSDFRPTSLRIGAGVATLGSILNESKVPAGTVIFSQPCAVPLRSATTFQSGSLLFVQVTCCCHTLPGFMGKEYRGHSGEERISIELPLFLIVALKS